MAIDNTNNWSPASPHMTRLVKEGRILTWRKSYNGTKDKKALTEFKGIVNIYEVRSSEVYIYGTHTGEYLEIRTLGKYHLPKGLDVLCADLFDLSFAYKLVAVDAEYLEIVVEESKDGSTNIDETVMEAMMDIQKKIVKQLSRRKAR